MLWASTSTKNPAYPDTLYVDELIGPETVNTMPEETVTAYQDHGDPKARLREGVDEAHALFDDLAKAGVDYDEVTATLEREGVEKFSAFVRRTAAGAAATSAPCSLPRSRSASVATIGVAASQR